MILLFVVQRTLSLRKAGHKTRRWALAVELKNAVGSGNHLRELLEERILWGNIGDAHEKVFEALDIDIHDLRNEIGDLVLLQTMLVHKRYNEDCTILTRYPLTILIWKEFKIVSVQARR
jgi:hypothetical protein